MKKKSVHAFQFIHSLENKLFQNSNNTPSLLKKFFSYRTQFCILILSYIFLKV